MSRAKRHYLPGLIWHITQRCHKREFLLRFAKDKHTWLRWLLEAKREYGLCILNFAVTSNHIHLMVQDRADGYEKVIAESIHLAAGRLAQEYNLRKERSGAFWEDRYHATAIESGEHFQRCLVYIDLNMVRAGVVDHPEDWPFGGYFELQQPYERLRNRLIDTRALGELLGVTNLDRLRVARKEWIDEALGRGELVRDPIWTESVAVGSEPYVGEVLTKLGTRAKGREIAQEGEAFVVRERSEAYLSVFGAKNANLGPKSNPKIELS